ncbi:Flp pilus assembly protein CpaB [Phenylobacterium sp.]|uniref:Flp pilus assembly protein CpaB n=1 Tax=Phenylobacterium sp. TaxID=1871053 RepID=UPI0035B0F86B
MNRSVGAMRLVTIVSLGASAVLGLAALFIAKATLPSKTAMAAAASAVAQQPVRGVPVVVAAKAIAYGERLQASHLKVAQYPQGAVPEGAFSTIEAVLKQDGGGAPVAITPMAEREPLLPAKLSGPGARASVAAEIAEGMRAYTIRVTDVSGVGGHALPGDHVDVILTRDLSKDQEHRNLVSQVVIQNVRVLGVDLNADPTSTKAVMPNTATLEVDMADAQKLSVASDLGTLSLALRRTGSTEVDKVAPLRSGQVVSGAPAGAPGPARAGSSYSAAAADRPAPPRRLITIVEGEGA